MNRAKVAGRVSAVMIGRDATRHLGEALSAVAAVADEMVYVDTGSADDSIAIARRHGARVYEFPWCDDFSRAKNFAVEQAGCPWILSVDTDEVLRVPGTKDILSAALPDPKYAAYVIYQDNVYDSGEVKPNPVARLFRNDPRIRFRNPVHECISEDVLEHFPGVGMPALDIHLTHHGYLSENMHGKHERNIALLRKWVESAPDHGFATFNLGNMLLEVGRPAEALSWLRKTHDHFRQRRMREISPYFTTFLVVYHKALLAAGLPEEAQRFGEMAEQWLLE